MLMKKIALISLFLNVSLIAQELPTLPNAPQPIIETPTSIMEETNRVTTSLSPESSSLTANLPISSETTQIKETQETSPVIVDLTLPAAPVMEAPKSLEELEQADEDQVDIGLSADVRKKVATLLNKLLSDEYVLYTKTLKYHWNVKGIVFHDFHAAFKEQYEALFDIVDTIAERARALGQPALGSLTAFSTFTRLKEINGQNLTAVQMVKQLLADHEAIIKTIRADIDETAKLGDQGTSNFLQDLIVKHEKIAWMLRATAAQ